jgi:fatty acid desaturase
MLKGMKQCIGWLDWKFVAGGLAVLLALALCGNLPALGIFAGATPLLLIIACLVPCLLPLALLRRAGRRQHEEQHASDQEQEVTLPRT